MATAIVGGPYTWSGGRDSEGHRFYTVVFRIVSDPGDGPANVMQTAGIGTPGHYWQLDDDIDIWAWCLNDMDVQPERKGENKFWLLTQKFSTKPPDRQRDPTNPVEDPLTEPQKVSGSFVKRTEEATKDRFGEPIVTSSHEQISGPQNEWDADGGDTITIEQNVAALELDVLAAMKNKVNDAPLWGLPARCIKFSSYTWDKKYYSTGSHYYTRRLEFDVRVNGFDRDLLDEGTKVLHGYWDVETGEWTLDVIDSEANMPDPNNPSHFDRFKDRNGENARVILDGEGKPFVPSVLTTDCAQCPDGAPTKMKVKTDTNREVTVEYVSGCTWTYTGEGTVTLTYDTDHWELTDSSIAATEWTLDGEDWDCLGGNSMTRTTGTGGLATATVSGQNTPGTIHVEKYEEANLLDLDIPVTF